MAGNNKEIIENYKDLVNFDRNTHFFGQIYISYQNQIQNFFSKYTEGNFKYIGAIHK